MSDSLVRNIESILFGAGKRLTVEHISTLVKSDSIKVQAALSQLKQEYDQKDTSLRVVTDGTFWKLTVREDYAETVKKLVKHTELSKTVMETLAIIAYKAPVLQSDVIKIRTNKGYDHLLELEELGFLTRQKQGRTKLIRLTQKFFDYFDLPEDALKARFATVREKELEVSEHEDARNQLLDGIEKAKEITTLHDEQTKREEGDHLQQLDEDIKTIESLETYPVKETFTQDLPSPLEPIKEQVGTLDVYDTESKEGTHWGEFEVYTPPQKIGGESADELSPPSSERPLPPFEQPSEQEESEEQEPEQQESEQQQDELSLPEAPLQKKASTPAENVQVALEKREGKGMFSEGVSKEVQQKIDQKIEQLLNPPAEIEDKDDEGKPPTLDEDEKKKGSEEDSEQEAKS